MNAIVAANLDWGIGFGGMQTIILPEDRRNFRKLTYGGVVIVGRRTFEQLRKPLDNRKNIVLTRDRSFNADGVIISHSVGEVLNEISGDDPDMVFVIGGGDIYRQFLPLCNYAYVTRIEAAPPSDTFFPDLDALPGWSLEHRQYANEVETEFESPHCSSFRNYIGEKIRYSFDLYKSNVVEDAYV